MADHDSAHPIAPHSTPSSELPCRPTASCLFWVRAFWGCGRELGQHVDSMTVKELTPWSRPDFLRDSSTSNETTASLGLHGTCEGVQRGRRCPRQYHAHQYNFIGFLPAYFGGIQTKTPPNYRSEPLFLGNNSIVLIASAAHHC